MLGAILTLLGFELIGETRLQCPASANSGSRGGHDPARGRPGRAGAQETTLRITRSHAARYDCRRLVAAHGVAVHS